MQNQEQRLLIVDDDEMNRNVQHNGLSFGVLRRSRHAGLHQVGPHRRRADAWD